MLLTLTILSFTRKKNKLKYVACTQEGIGTCSYIAVRVIFLKFLNVLFLNKVHKKATLFDKKALEMLLIYQTTLLWVQGTMVELVFINLDLLM